MDSNPKPSPNRGGTSVLPPVKLSLDSPLGLVTLEVIPSRFVTWARR